MASPQKENGYTPIANEILEALARTNLSSGESRILRVVFRKTYGWTKPNDQISLSIFTQMTGMTRRGVCKSISSLVSRRILAREQKGTSFVTKYWVIKDYDKWLAREQKGTSEQKDTSTREREGILLGNRKAPTITTIQKQTKQRVAREQKDTREMDFPFLKNESFLSIFTSFLEMRTKIRKPATERAKIMILNDLHKHTLEIATAMLEQSVRKSWQDVYPLKSGNWNSPEGKL